MDASAVRRTIVTRHALESQGVGPREFDRQLASGQLRCLHRGRYVRSSDWDDAFGEDRHLMRVFAADALRRDSDGVASHTSAAVLWELPLFRLQPSRVHISGPSTSGSVTVGGGVARHRVGVPAADRGLRLGIPCTSLSRTIVDVICGAPEEAALACADAAFRLVAWDDDGRTYDLDAAAAFRGELNERIGRAAGARGIRRARRITAIADGRAQLPGESVSRLYLLQLGFATPRLQVAVPAPSSRDFLVDFGLDDVGAWAN